MPQLLNMARMGMLASTLAFSCAAVLPHAYAAETASVSASATPTLATNTANTTTVGESTIHRFVKGDFDGQMAMIQHWPEDNASKSKLYDALENDQLYSDAEGHAFLVNSDQTVTDYETGQASHVAVDSLTEVTMNNAMRQMIDLDRAKTNLSSPDVSVRMNAVKALIDDPTSVDEALLSERLKLEKDNQVKTILTRIQAQKDIESGDAKRELSGAEVLSASNDPEVLSLVQGKLTQGNLSPTLTAALTKASHKIATRIQISEWEGYLFSGLSLASILLLAALGLAITYGLLGVINMAHGELIMIGAYTTYVMQNFFQHYFSAYSNWYLIAAIPAAFAVSGMIGMIIERIVIRPLYGRQLETLLATFGVSLILMQVVRMIFGAQNVEVANPTWMSGGIAMSPSLTLPYSRVAIIGFTVLVILSVKFLISGTRFGLFIRAVTQNRTMARAVGVRSSRIDMLAFGLGSGLAGLAGCALSQIGNVGPDLGQNYIIDAFLVVVVGGVGQLLGAFLAALGLGISGKLLEVWMGAVLAKILLLGLIILFIQCRPQGLFAIKGRFVE